MYRIADFFCSITFTEGQGNSPALIPSFEPFRVEALPPTAELLFSLLVDDTLPALDKEHCERIRRVESDNGDIIVDQIAAGGYQFIIKNIYNQNCCLLHTDSTFTSCCCALRGDEGMRTYGLNNALMLIFAFAACNKHALLLHASTVREAGWGYAFTAKSGTGKSTHVAQWLENIPGCDMINDDNPIIRIIDGDAYIYGSPWSGKTPCYRNLRARLGAIVKVNRADENSVKPASTIDAFVTLLSACATMKWDSDIFDSICSTVTSFIEATQHYNLFCRPDREAALVCHEAISRRER